ncbi:MAG TPA: hypothetical protein PKA00_22690 [Saprospiraceae bacterium]|nr:hypothetical protein [Saprospiraceae bacterium]HMQ85737.1 hypothetical protein [Saprospiraceae bacterium]
MLTLRSFLCFCLFCLTIDAAAQSWESVRIEDFSTANNDLSNLVDFAKSGFVRNNFGATGSTSDRSASSNFSTGMYIAIRADLSPGYEYRLKLNIKSPNSAIKKLQFYYGTSTANAYFTATPLGTPFGIPQIASTLPGQDISSEVVSGLSGSYWFFAGHTTPNVAGAVFFDNFTLERRSLVVPATFSFMADSLQVFAGDSVALCIQPDAPLSNAADVSISLSSDPNPHFSGQAFPLSIHLEAGDTTARCTTLHPTSDTTAKTYTFQIDSEQAGLQAEFRLRIDPCPGYAGPDRTVCAGTPTQLGCDIATEPDPSLCYHWLPEEGLDDPFAVRPWAVVEEMQAYHVYVTDQNGDFIGTDFVELNVNPTPSVAISSNPNPPIIIGTGSITLDAGNEYPPGWYSWMSDLPNFHVEDQTSVSVSLSGEYTVLVTNDFGCTGQASIQVADGTDDVACTQALQAYFEAEGFYKMPVTVVGDDIGVAARDNCLVQDEAKLLIQLTTEDPGFNISGIVETFLSTDNEFLEGITSRKGFITKDQNFCQNLINSTCGYDEMSVEAIKAEIETLEYASWTHISVDNQNNCAFIYSSSKTPASTLPWSTQIENIFEAIQSFTDEVLMQPLPISPGLLSKDQLVIQNLEYTKAATIEDEKINLTYISSNEECLTLETKYCFTPSGAVVNIPPGSILKFGFKTEYANQIDKHALSGFSVLNNTSPNFGIHRAASLPKNLNEFYGYYNINTGTWYQPSGIDANTVAVTLGELFSDSPCSFFSVHKRVFAPNLSYAPNNHPQRRGALVASLFDNPAIGSFENSAPTDQQYISLCLPSVSYDAFNMPEGALLDPEHELNPIINQNSGWLFAVKSEIGSIIIFHTRLDETGNWEYRRFNPCSGTWEYFDPPSREIYDFLSAFLQVVIENGHLALDFAGFIPFFGEPADLINGIWYAAEGDVENALFSFSALIPVAGVVPTSGKYVFKILDESGQLVNLTKRVIKKGDNVPLSFVDDLTGTSTQNAAEWLGKQTYEAGLTPNQAEELANWLFDEDNYDILLSFAESPKLIKAWKVAFNSPLLRTDISFLSKLSEILEPTILNKFPNGQADVDAIVKAIKHPCCGSTHPFLKSATEHLDDVKHLVENFDIVDGFNQVITALKNQNFYAQDGASHMLTKLKTLEPSDVSRLEGKILDADNLEGICTNCLFDIELELSPGQFKKLELKSYKTETIDNMAYSSKFKNQFKSYLAAADNMDGFEYIFNIKKTTDLTNIKQNFQSLFTNEATGMYDTFGQLKFQQLFGVDNVDDFLDDVVSNLDSPIYNFIKIE